MRLIGEKLTASPAKTFNQHQAVAGNRLCLLMRLSRDGQNFLMGYPGGRRDICHAYGETLRTGKKRASPRRFDN